MIKAEKSIYKLALEHWGMSSQVSMAMGECGELIAALNQFFTQKKGTKEDVITEIADVEIMCAQLRIIVGSDLVDKEKEKKLERLRGILSGEIEHPHNN